METPSEHSAKKVPPPRPPPPRPPPPMLMGATVTPLTDTEHSHQNLSSRAKNSKITKEDIGPPFDFWHVSHIGWDLKKNSFAMEHYEHPKLKRFLQQAGVSESQFKDPETRKFIFDFLVRQQKLTSEPTAAASSKKTSSQQIPCVTWDPNKETVDDPLLKQFLFKSGVQESQLKDPQIRQFIYDFLSRNGAIQTATDNLPMVEATNPDPGPVQPVPKLRTALSIPEQVDEVRVQPPIPAPRKFMTNHAVENDS